MKVVVRKQDWPHGHARRDGVAVKIDVEVDYLIIGGRIAGAAIAYWLAPHAKVLMLERKVQPGYDSSAGAAAIFMETYGPPAVRALTCASRDFFEKPPAGFTDRPILTPRGALVVAEHGQQAKLDEFEQTVRSAERRTVLLDADGACLLVPVLRHERVLGAVFEPDAADLDVAALHQGYLRGFYEAGGVLSCNAEVSAMHYDGGRWHVMAGGRMYAAPVVVNAAGAWCDEIAALAGAAPSGQVHERRSAFTFMPPFGTDIERWPMFIGLDGSYYVKPDGDLLLGCPSNTRPVGLDDEHQEVREMALAISRIESMTTLAVQRPQKVWAGLRSFVSDRGLVGGFDPDVPGFFWAAGQGGNGIQSSPAIGEAYAALLRGLPLPRRIADFGVSTAALSPDRIR
jgi:D-arginine dehydrogenase